MTIEQETVERLAVENETLAQELRRLGGDDADAAVATAGWNEWVATVLRALLAERDAALAEVARLSTPPDDAEVAELVTLLVDRDNPVGMQAADALARLSTALAAETAKREAMEAELRSVEIDLFEAEDKFHIASFYISDEQTKTCVMDRVKWMAKAGSRVRETLAKHGSK